MRNLSIRIIKRHQKDAAAILRDLANDGKSKGVLTYKEVMDAFEKIAMPPEQIEKYTIRLSIWE